MDNTIQQLAEIETCPSKDDYCQDWCDRVRTSCPEPDKRLVEITEQHAYSLSCLVKYFREMIGQASKAGVIDDAQGRSDAFTISYCDELLEDLGG